MVLAHRLLNSMFFCELLHKSAIIFIFIQLASLFAQLLHHLLLSLLLFPLQGLLQCFHFGLSLTVAPSLLPVFLLQSSPGFCLHLDLAVPFLSSQLPVLMEVATAGTCSRPVYVFNFLDPHCHRHKLVGALQVVWNILGLFCHLLNSLSL